MLNDKMTVIQETHVCLCGAAEKEQCLCNWLPSESEIMEGIRSAESETQLLIGYEKSTTHQEKHQVCANSKVVRKPGRLTSRSVEKIKIEQHKADTERNNTRRLQKHRDKLIQWRRN